jgi:hypothetical protein
MEAAARSSKGITVNEAAAVAVPRNWRRDMPVGFMGTGKYNGIDGVGGTPRRPGERCCEYDRGEVGGFGFGEMERSRLLFKLYSTASHQMQGSGIRD